VLLLVIGEKWLNSVDDDGRRRLDSETDYVRLEIESAIGRGIPIVPILLGATPMVNADVLPQSIREVAYRSAARVRPDPDFNGDVGRIVESIKRACGGVGPLTLDRRLPVNRRWIVRILSTAALISGGSVVGFLAGKRENHPTVPVRTANGAQVAVAIVSDDNKHLALYRFDVTDGRVHYRIEGGGGRIPVGLMNEPSGVTAIAAAASDARIPIGANGDPPKSDPPKQGDPKRDAVIIEHVLVVVAIDANRRCWVAACVNGLWKASWFPITVPIEIDEISLTNIPETPEMELFGRSRTENKTVRMRLLGSGTWVLVGE
jgi:hypothetical protein